MKRALFVLLAFSTLVSTLFIFLHYDANPRGAPRENPRKIRAEAGEATAQYSAGLEYYFGLEAEPNLVEAYAWFSLAIANDAESVAIMATERSHSELKDPQQRSRLGSKAIPGVSLSNTIGMISF